MAYTLGIKVRFLHFNDSVNIAAKMHSAFLSLILLEESNLNLAGSQICISGSYRFTRGGAYTMSVLYGHGHSLRTVA